MYDHLFSHIKHVLSIYAHNIAHTNIAIYLHNCKEILTTIFFSLIIIILLFFYNHSDNNYFNFKDTPGLH